MASTTLAGFNCHSSANACQLTVLLVSDLCSLQVGQVILNLPNSMAKAGLPLGTFFQLWAAVVSLYTLWLLSNLYQEYKRNAVSTAPSQKPVAGHVCAHVCAHVLALVLPTGTRCTRQPLSAPGSCGR